MRVAVTGSGGFIGTALRVSLESGGHEVVRLPRGTVDGLAGADAVVNLAGVGIGDKRWTATRRREVLESRTSTTRRVADAVAAMPDAIRPAVLLSGSAVGYYGDRGDEQLTEESASGDLYVSEVCRAWEAAAQPAIDAGVRTAFLRTGIVLGSNGGALGKLLPLFKLGLGGRLGPGTQYMSWIALEDEVGAIRFLLDHDVHGPVNLTAPNAVTNAVFTKTLGRVLRRPTVLAVPRFGPRLLLGTQLAYELLFASQRVVPAALERAGYPFAHRDLEPALRTILAR